MSGKVYIGQSGSVGGYILLTDDETVAMRLLEELAPYPDNLELKEAELRGEGGEFFLLREGKPEMHTLSEFQPVVFRAASAEKAQQLALNWFLDGGFYAERNARSVVPSVYVHIFEMEVFILKPTAVFDSSSSS